MLRKPITQRFDNIFYYCVSQKKKKKQRNDDDGVVFNSLSFLSVLE